jgi:hypothetical protein
MNPVRLLRRLGQLLPRFLKDRRGSADLNTYLLLTAAGCTMVGLTAPHLFKSSKTASDTFEKQVEILQRGSSGGVGGAGGGGGAAGGGDWNLGGQAGLGQLAGQLGGGGGGGQLTNGGGQLANGGGQLANGGGQLANGGGQLANGGGPTVTADGAPVAKAANGKKAAAR